MKLQAKAVEDKNSLIGRPVPRGSRTLIGGCQLFDHQSGLTPISPAAASEFVLQSATKKGRLSRNSGTSASVLPHPSISAFEIFIQRAMKDLLFASEPPHRDIVVKINSNLFHIAALQSLSPQKVARLSVGLGRLRGKRPP